MLVADGTSCVNLLVGVSVTCKDIGVNVAETCSVGSRLSSYVGISVAVDIASVFRGWPVVGVSSGVHAKRITIPNNMSMDKVDFGILCS